MQAILPFRQAADLQAMRGRLAACFETIRSDNRPDPVSQLVRSFIGSRTHDEQSWDVFERLVSRYPNWDALADAEVADIEATIAGVTYPEKKAPELRQALRAIRSRFGQINLDFLAACSVDQAVSCLKQIHGIGPKIAAAILNFSVLRKRAFVIDTHVLRILRRFGFVSIKSDTQRAYDAVMAAADAFNADDLFELHWHLKGLGQTVCTHQEAMCDSCPLADICQRKHLKILRVSPGKTKLEETSTHIPLGHEQADFFLKGGLLRGTLNEIFADPGHEPAATGFTASLARRAGGDRHSLWIRQDFSAHEFGALSPTGLVELGLDPSRLLLLSVPHANDALQAANDALSCAALGAVVIEVPGSAKNLDLLASRRLTLAADRKSVTAFLLRSGSRLDASTAETRWLVRSAASSQQREDWGYPVFEAELMRNRHGKTGRWLMEWNGDECVFQSPAAHSGALVSAPADRQAQAA